MAKKAKLKRALRRQVERELHRRVGASSSAPSKPRAPAPSRWHAAPGDSRANLEAFDTFAPLRNKLRHIGEERGHYAGVPMPLEGTRMVVEPTYPYAQGLMTMNVDSAEPEAEPHPELDGAVVRNTFWSGEKRCQISIVQLASGRITFGVQPGIHHLQHDLATLGCAEAWGIEQESAALELLGMLLPHRKFKQYLLTGAFLERSSRSQVTYMFRKLKPTIAIVPSAKGGTRILAALCLHPIAYYSGSWAGAMTPTDDVVAHLMLMRGDEPMFWRRANQHPAWAPQAGIGS